MTACLPPAVSSRTLTLSRSPALPISPSVSTEPKAATTVGSSPSSQRAMSKSWIVMSRKMPPDRLMYSTGGAPGSREVMLTISTAPTAPSSIALRTARKCGSKRRLKPTISAAPVSSTTRRQALTRATSRSIGFSQKIALPARAKRSIRSAWVSVGVQITTASTSPAASIASIDRTSAPYRPAIASAAGATASATATRRAPAVPVIARACTFPMRPAPSKPKRMVMRPSS